MFLLVAETGVEPVYPEHESGVLPLHHPAIWRRAEVPTPNLSVNRISNPSRPPRRFTLRMTQPRCCFGWVGRKPHKHLRHNHLAPAEGLEPSCPCGRRFSGPLRYQFRYKLAYGGPSGIRTHTLIAFETTAFTDYTIGPFVAETVGIEPTNIGVKDRRLNHLAKSLCGAGGRNRTPDLMITRHQLFLLSYTSIYGTG